MRRRGPYLLAFLLLLAAETAIGLFARDRFVRPYLGDVLAAALLCCLARLAFPDKIRLLPAWVFLFCAGAEGLQAFGLTERLGLEGTVPGVLLGATFDPADLLCYLTGCLLVFLAEALWRRSGSRAS